MAGLLFKEKEEETKMDEGEIEGKILDMGFPLRKAISI
jgi:hypothetical protein